MAHIKIDVDDEQLRQALRVAPNKMVNAMHRSLNRSAVQTQRYFRENITKRRSVFTGHLRESVHFQFKNKLTVVVEPEAKYADSVEFGSRPHFVSYRKIKPWAKFHGLDPFAVQWSILTKGTRKHPFLQKTVKQSEQFAIEDMQKKMNKAIKEIL